MRQITNQFFYLPFHERKDGGLKSSRFDILRKQRQIEILENCFEDPSSKL